MALPKRKISKSRRDKRRTHYKATISTTMNCPKCLQPKLTHRVCPNCGYYNGRSVIAASE
ncbi:50S ribosomal protein L32 [Candidatus Marinimicrobia bacterium MT.SAG.2]|nr:50S ribosomal protein L32 [Candidatus Marinimicrobia bacterium MT.SAG.2]